MIDFLVIGSGIAGLSFALRAAEIGQVLVITKKSDCDTATNLAQGGLAAVMAADDSFDLHIEDTLNAGAGLCDKEVVRFVVKEGPDRLKELIQLGARFARSQENSKQFDLGREGGHSRRRIVHAHDLTGKEIERALLESCRGNPNIELRENHACIDLLLEQGRCVGASVLAADAIQRIHAKITVLCTGGAGKVYQYTCNPDIATGDGIAMAFRAGAKISNMEFFQFHPTCLYHRDTKNFLISEALRGEGAILLNQAGERFMEKYAPEMMELATRDTVARAIDREMKISGSKSVYLDISHRGKEFIEKRFPTIYAFCKKLGYDIAQRPFPVVPAAHYLCGGVLVDQYGRTSVDGLYALGECACTGLHGGNRLASNSLLEAIVFASRAYTACAKELPSVKIGAENENCSGQQRKEIEEKVVINHNWELIRKIMWNYVGIVRSDRRLMLAGRRIQEIHEEVSTLCGKYYPSTELLELRNIGIVSLLIIKAAQMRKESRGLHYTVNYPERDDGQRFWNIFQRQGQDDRIEVVARKYI
ncbi:MAG: L-aspartate oxidase [Desulfobulbaceae bacterium]|jgi:L-aspartate oxidase|nr:L-aspartate oxidase [Desulfobulbaceae bacterium]